MRTTCTLLATTIVVMGIIAGALWLVGLLGQGSPASTSAKAREVVFVDVAKLVPLHPDAKALAAIKATLVDVKSGSKWSLPQGAALPALHPSTSVLTKPPSVSRQKLEAELAQSAVGALGRLETDQREALDARLRASRELMARSAHAELSAQVREIEDDAAAKLRALNQHYAADRVNAQIRIAALGSAQKGVRALEDPLGAVGRANTQDENRLVLVREPEKSSSSQVAAMSARLHSIQADLGQMIATTEAETNTIEGEARSQIASLRAESAARIDSELAKQEAEGTRKIDEGITMARGDILRELGSLDRSFVPLRGTSPAGSARVAVTYADVAGGSASGGADLRAMDEALLDLESRIISDMCGAVRKLAEEKGVRVTFSRKDRQAPDRTADFAEMLRGAGWDANGPIVASKRG